MPPPSLFIMKNLYNKKLNPKQGRGTAKRRGTVGSLSRFPED